MADDAASSTPPADQAAKDPDEAGRRPPPAAASALTPLAGNPHRADIAVKSPISALRNSCAQVARRKYGGIAPKNAAQAMLQHKKGNKQQLFDSGEFFMNAQKAASPAPPAAAAAAAPQGSSTLQPGELSQPPAPTPQ